MMRSELKCLPSVRQALKQADMPPVPSSNGAPPAPAALEAGALPAETQAPGSEARPPTGAREAPADVCVVDTPEEARRVARLLSGRYRERVFACDTEARRCGLLSAPMLGEPY